MLGDEEKKETYDKYGEEAVKGEGGGGGGGAEDIFSAFFGGGGGRSRQSRGPKKGEDFTHPLKVSLAQLYNGKTSKLAISRDRIKIPDGVSKSDAVKICNRCNGRGAVMKMRQIGPGMIQQMQMKCDSCGGSGSMVAPGVKVVKERKVLEVHVDKGMKNGQKITFRGEADEVPGCIAGDVVFVIQEKEHDLFKRKNADLFMQKEISLVEALTGTQFVVDHLDGRKICISTPAGDVIEDQRVMAIEGEGMPIHGNPYEKGKLYVLLKVKMPEPNSLTQQQVQVLKSIFPGASEHIEENEDTINEYEFAQLETVDLKQFGKTGARGANEAYDSDEEGQGGQRVGCQQQ